MGRVVATLGIALLVLVAAVVLFLHTAPARDLVRSQLAALLQQQNIAFDADELDYNLLALRVALRNVTVRSPDASDLPPFAQIDRIAANLSLTQLLRGRYVVESGEAAGVRVHYVVDGTRDNVPRPPTDPDRPSEPLDYLITAFRLEDAEVRYEQREQQIDVSLPVRSLTVAGDELTDRHTVRLDAGGGVAVAGARRAAIEQLSAEIDLGDDDLRIATAGVSADGARLNVRGTVTGFDAPRLDLNAAATLDAARASAIAGLADPVGGTVSVTAAIEGPAATPRVDGRVEGADLSFRQLTSVRLSGDVAFDGQAGRVSVSSLDLRAPQGQVSGNATLALRAGDQSSAAITVTGLDAEALMRTFEVPYRVASRVDARVGAEWPALDYLDARGTASATLTPTASRASRASMPIAGRVDVSGSGAALDADLRQIAAAGALLNGRVRLSDRRLLDGTVTLRADDVSRVTSAAEAVLGRAPGALVPVAVSGPLEATARIGGSVSTPAVAARLSAPALTVGNASGMQVAGGFDYTPARVDIQQLDVTWAEARARATGRVELQGPRRLDLSVNAESLELDELLRALEQDIPASGTFGLSGRVGGTMARPAGDATLTGTNLVAYGEQWGTLTGEVATDGGDAVRAHLRVDKPQPEGQGRIEARGTYDLGARTYDVDLRSSDVQLLGLTLPNGQLVRGALTLSAQGAGTVDNPAGNAVVTADALEIDGRPLDRIETRMRLADRRATIEAAAPRFGVTADAAVAIDAPYPARLTARVADLQLASLPLELTSKLEGRISAELTGAGDLAAVEAMTANATITTFEGSWNGHPFGVDAPAELRYDDQRLAIDQLRIVAQDSTVSVSGELPVNEGGTPGTVTVDAQANLATLANYLPADVDVTASGDLTLTGTVTGTLAAIDPDLTLALSDGAIATPALAPGVSAMQMRVRVSEGVAAVEQLDANWGAATITAKGRVPLEILPDLPVAIAAQGGPASFTAAVDNLDFAQVPGAPDGLAGAASLRAELSAASPDLNALEGHVTLPELRAEFRGLTLAQQQPTVVRLAGGRAQLEPTTLSGSAGTITAAGNAALAGDGAISLDANGTLDVAAVSLFSDAVEAEGTTTLDIAARGTLAAPELTGSVELENANFISDEPTLAAEDVQARIELAGPRATLASLSGELNGGRFEGSGFVELGEGDVSDVQLTLITDDVAYDAPLDLRSLSDATITVSKRDDEIVVGGQVTISEASLTGDINFDEGLLAGLNARRRLDLTEERNPLLERVRFAVDVDTATPILVDNNLAHAEVTADLRVLGTPYELGLSGRLEVLEDSEVTLNERRYRVARGAITFIDERRILPSLDLVLNTSASSYDVTIEVSGEPGDTETVLTSDPALPEPDIMALLVTGRTLDEMRGEEYEVAREQMLSYLAGRVGSQLGRGLERATGLSTVRVEPQLIANEADPSARLTVGQDLTDDLELIYSTSLTDSADQIWILELGLRRRFNTRAVRQPDGSYRLEIRHDVRFGGQPAPERLPPERPAVASVTVTANGPMSEPELRKRLGVEAGDRYDFFAARNGVEEIEEALVDQGRLQSRVRLERESTPAGVALHLQVEAGPRVDLAFDGITPPGKIVEEIQRQWRRGIFDTQRIDDASEVLVGWLMDENYLQASVEAEIDEASPDSRRVRFLVDAGPRFSTVALAFEGAAGVSEDELADIVKSQNLNREVFTDPIQVTELLERYYREQGYLVAEIDEPHYEFQDRTARVVFTVREGPRFTIRDMTAEGTSALEAPVLLGQLPIQPGDPFLPFAAENALAQIRDVYWERGYNDARADYELALDREAGVVDVRFRVEEGAQSIVAGITVEGNEHTSSSLVSGQVELEPQEPLDVSALANSRRNLYDTGAFSVVNIDRQPLSAGDGTGNDGMPVQLDIAVREVQPLQIRYGISYDTDRGLGGVLDVSNHNTLGKARVVGLAGRYDGQAREARAYFSQPSLVSWPIQTTASVYYREERNTGFDIGRHLDIERRGASVQQERQLSDSYVWSWGARYERAHTIDRTPGGSLDERITVVPLTTALTRDTRDEVLDATRGAFSSQAFSYSPGWLGSDRPFIRYFGQYFHYFPLEPERRERLTNELLRPRFVFATGVRLGLADGIGGEVPLSERFFAGGGTSVRGFAQNALGPQSSTGLALGGAAMLVINNELRFPLVSIFDGVVFADVGSLLPRISADLFTELRKTAGAGLRVRTPWFLLRGDYGLILDRRNGERRGRFYFSLGQAF